MYFKKTYVSVIIFFHINVKYIDKKPSKHVYITQHTFYKNALNFKNSFFLKMQKSIRICI